MARSTTTPELKPRMISSSESLKESWGQEQGAAPYTFPLHFVIALWPHLLALLILALFLLS